MGSVSLVRPVARVVWNLRACMARRKVSNVALAAELGDHATSVARLKAQDVLPKIGGEKIEQIRVAIDRLSRDEYGPCYLKELIGFEGDE